MLSAQSSNDYESSSVVLQRGGNMKAMTPLNKGFVSPPSRKEITNSITPLAAANGGNHRRT